MNNEERIERAAEARAILASPMITEVFDAIREEYVLELTQAAIGDLRATDAHASIRVLERVRQKLQSYQNDAAFIRNK